MLKPEYTGQFKKDLKTVQKRQYDIEALKRIICLLCTETTLPPKNRGHQLTGILRGRRECHIAPDWILIYKIGNGLIVFERTGTHADLFGR